MKRASASGDEYVAKPDSSLIYKGGTYPWYVVSVLLLVSVLSYLDRFAINVLVVPIQNDMGLSETQMGILLGPAFTLFYAAAGLPMGKVADHYSRRNLLMAGLSIWSLGTFGAGFAERFDVLFFARAVIGIGEACLIPAAFSLIADYFEPSRRGRAMAVVTVGMAAGSGLALIGSGTVLAWMEQIAHRDLPIVGIRAAWELVFISFGIAGLMLNLLLLSIKEPSRKDQMKGEDAGSFSFLKFVKANRSSIALIMAPYILVGYTLHVLAAWAPTLLVRRYGMTLSDAAQLKGITVLIIGSVAAMVGGAVGDHFTRKYSGGRFLLVLVLAPFIFPALALVCLGTGPWMAAAGMSLIMATGGLILPSAYTAMQDIVPGGIRGRTLALYTLLHQLIGLGLAPTITGLVTDNIFGDRSFLHLSMLIAAAPAWILILLCGYYGRSHFSRMQLAATTGSSQSER